METDDTPKSFDLRLLVWTPARYSWISGNRAKGYCSTFYAWSVWGNDNIVLAQNATPTFYGEVFFELEVQCTLDLRGITVEAGIS